MSKLSNTDIASNPRLAQDSGPKKMWLALMIVSMGYLLSILANPTGGIAQLPVRFLLKDRLHLSATAFAGFMAIVGIPWYLKPLAGIFTDCVTVGGRRRKPYLLASTVSAILLWFLLGALHLEYKNTLVLVLILNIALVVLATTLGGFLVEWGQDLQCTGRMSSARVFAENLAGLIAGPIGGFIASRVFGLTAGICIGCLAAVFAVFYYSVNEGKTESEQIGAGTRILAQLKIIAKSKTMWLTSGFWLLVRFSPGFQTPLFFYQSETLHFDAQFLGMLAMVSGVLGLLGALIYAAVCRRFSLLFLLVSGTLLNIASVLIYKCYVSRETAIAIEAIVGLANALGFLPIMDLLVRATPRGAEAIGYALLFSLGNVASSLSDLFGSWAYEILHHNFEYMILLNAGTTAVVLLMIPVLPRSLLSDRTRD